MTILYRVIFLTLLLGASQFFVKAQQGSAVNNPLARLEKEIVAFEEKDRKQAPSENALLFVGSSSVRFWNTLTIDMDPVEVINRGFGGSTFPELLYYYDRIVKPYNPRGIVVYEGDNDLTKKDMTPEMVLENLKTFYNKIQDDFPGIRVWFIAIKPSIARKNLLSVVHDANDLISTFASETQYLEFLDVATPMLQDDGSIMSDIFIKDNLHMNAKGYGIWKKVIRPQILEEYGQNAKE